MERAKFVAVVAAWTVRGACATVTPAPGADQVKMTKDPQDVAACKAVGNVKVENSATEFRNQVIGVGGNTALVTSGLVSFPVDGIAYHCP